jgi:signal transduction histidine kinase
MQKSGIQLIVDVDEKIPGLFVDRYRVQTALFNLIQNALEAMSGGGKISVTARAVPQSNAVAITVHDNGPGIPPELLARVCEPFFSTHTDEGLRGLGLAIVQDIVKIHGGRIEMKSSPDEGTQIVLYFPIVENVTSSVDLPYDAPSFNKP